MKCCPGPPIAPILCVSYWLSSSEKTVCRRCEISSHKFLILSDSDNMAALGRWKYTRRSIVAGSPFDFLNDVPHNASQKCSKST